MVHESAEEGRNDKKYPAEKRRDVMKSIRFAIFLILLVVTMAFPISFSYAGPPSKTCDTIRDGLLDSAGNPIELGYDQWGYNYQAHMFNGLYENSARPIPPVTESDTNLIMKWNDAWLSNMDCDKDGKLDRHYGFTSYIGSGAWLTNHQKGTYEDDGVTYKWEYFVKIVAVPSSANAINEVWYTADGVEIGPVIWGAFAVIQEVYNDQGTAEHGLLYKSPASPGFGTYQP